MFKLYILICNIPVIYWMSRRVAMCLRELPRMLVNSLTLWVALGKQISYCAVILYK